MKARTEGRAVVIGWRAGCGFLAPRQVPLDVVLEALVDGEGGPVAQQLGGLLHAQGPALGHQPVALDRLYLQLGEIGLHDRDQIAHRAGAAVGQVEDLVARFRVGDGQADAVHQVVDVGEVETFVPLAVDGQLLAPHGRLDEQLPDPPADAAGSVEGRGAHDGEGEVEHLLVGNHDLLAAHLEGPVDADGLERVGLGDGLGLEVAVGHARRQVDEVRLDVAGVVDGVFQGAKAVVEGGVRVLVRPPGVRHRRQVHDHVGLDGQDQLGQGVVVAGVLRVEGDARLAQKIEPLVQHPHVQLAGRAVAEVGAGGQQVVHLQAVDDVNAGSPPGEIEREVMPDETGTTNQDNLLLRKVVHATHPSGDCPAQATPRACRTLSGPS